MADHEHLEILNRGVDIWNQWRQDNPEVKPDLTWADLNDRELPEANLSNVNLMDARLARANLIKANLQAANLTGGFLSRALLNGANLTSAILRHTDLSWAILIGTNLTDAHFEDSILTGTELALAILNRAHMERTTLWMTVFAGTSLTRVSMANATMFSTRFADVDLSSVTGIDSVIHEGPSTIGIDTIYRSGGKISKIFLRGCGVPDGAIALANNIALAPIDYYSCFISHSSKDLEFATQLRNDLRQQGVRCFYAPYDMKIGDRTRRRLYREIHGHDKLLIILSQHSIDSDWVEDEVETAYEIECQQDRTVLFPVRIDDTIWDTAQAWAAKLRRQRHIGDFRDWTDDAKYQVALTRLLRDLQQEDTTDA